MLALLSAGGLAIGCQPRQGSPSQNSTSVAPRTEAAEQPPQVDAPAEGSAEPAASAETAPTPSREPVPSQARSEAPVEPAPTADPPAGRRGAEVHRITFQDLEINMQQDMVFDPTQLTERVKELDGQRVRLKGFISPGIFQQTGIDRFPLVMNTECKFGPGGQADHVIIVDLLDGLTTSFTMRPITVEGRLSLQPWNGPDGNTWALYHLAGEKLE